VARPAAKELTERELEVMNVFWDRSPATAAEARDALANQGLVRTYTTVANLVRLLVEKNFLHTVNDLRPFQYRPMHSRNEVSGRLVRDFVDRVFGGSRHALFRQLLDDRPLTDEERRLLEQRAAEDGP
jgi:predicted transcriptional regulator